MTPLSDIRLTLDFGSRSRVLFADELEELLAGRSLREALCRLLYPHAVHKGRGDSVPSSRQEDTNVIISSPSDSDPFPILQETKGPEETSCLEARAHYSAPAMASLLADRLDDWKSIAFYTEIAHAVPFDVVQHALTAALDVPTNSLRRSRAAYFTAIVMPHLALRRPRPSRV